MAETKSNLILAGILTLVIAASSGVTYYITDSGTKTSCKNGWEYVSEGNWQCTTSTGFRQQLCFEVYDSANTPNYWCKIGNLVLVEQPVDTPTGQYQTCTPNGCR